MLRCITTLAAAALVACAAPQDAPRDQAPGRPNIVLILADDLGWADVPACDPLERTFYRTPHLDRLAAEGLVHTQAYAGAPNCAPSRAALATGLRYPSQPIYTVGSGARGAKEARRMEPVKNRTDLPREFDTLAERLGARGYATWFLGKWHLGKVGTSGPLDHGFEVNVAGNHTGTPKSYFSPYQNPQLADGPEGEYLTPRLAREACELIRARDERPFFLQLSTYSVHTPLRAPRADVDRFRDQAADRGHGDARYAAMIANLDAAVGQVLATLEAEGIADETLVVFTSDNGGMGGYVAEGLPGRDITSQAPLRGGKGMLYEGGIRVPFIVRWPGVVEPGVQDGVVSHLDLSATFCAASGAPVEDGATHGVDLGPMWRTGHAQPRQLWWYFPGYLERNRTTFRTRPAIATRSGSVKAIHFFEDARTEVYDLDQDPGERSDLAAGRPQVGDAQGQALLDWLDSQDAPLPTFREGGATAEGPGE